MANNISNLAHVSPKAKIGDNVTIDPFAYIEDDVEIGDNCHIRSHVAILNGARIGKDNDIYHGAIIAAEPQDFRWHGEKSYVKIGDNNRIREQVIINRSIRENGATCIGSNSFILAQSHIGHDTCIGDYSVLGNGVKIAGDCKIGSYTILSTGAKVHERCEIGDWVLIKGGCRVNGNIPPYAIMAHNPIVYYGVNEVILRKGGFSEETIKDISKCFRHIFRSTTATYNALRRIQEDIQPSAERDAIIDFVKAHDFKLAAVDQNSNK